MDSSVEHKELSMLRMSIRSQILFHQVSQIGLQRGLYLCYVQAKSSLDEGMQVIVSNTSPSILPYVKMRGNPHVTSDEWRWTIQLGVKSRIGTSNVTSNSVPATAAAASSTQSNYAILILAGTSWSYIILNRYKNYVCPKPDHKFLNGRRRRRL